MRFLTVLALCFGMPAQTSDYDRGVALIEKGQAEAAIPLLVRATQAAPKDARAWKALGVAHAAQGQYSGAEPAFARACKLDPKLEDACYYHGRALYALDRFEPSLEALSAAPDSWKVRLGRAQSLEALGRAQEAENEFQRAIRHCGNTDPRPAVAYGLFLIRQGRHQEAVQPLEATLKRFPRSAEAHTHLGRSLLDQANVVEAIPHFQQALAIEPSSAQAHLLLAKAYVRAGRAAEAQPHFEAAAKLEQASQAAK